MNSTNFILISNTKIGWELFSADEGRHTRIQGCITRTPAVKLKLETKTLRKRLS